jgi:hypothetical protein
MREKKCKERGGRKEEEGRETLREEGLEASRPSAGVEEVVVIISTSNTRRSLTPKQQHRWRGAFQPPPLSPPTGDGRPIAKKKKKEKEKRKPKRERKEREKHQTHETQHEAPAAKNPIIIRGVNFIFEPISTNLMMGGRECVWANDWKDGTVIRHSCEM